MIKPIRTTESVKVTDTIQMTAEVTDTTETLVEHVRQSNVATSISASLATVPLPDLLKPFAPFRVDLKREVVNMAKESFKTTTVRRNTSARTVTLEVQPGVTGTKYAVKTCHRRCLEVYLLGLDFLTVVYRRRLMGIRRRRVKLPKYVNGTENYISVKQPLGALEYWSLNSDSPYVINEHEYKREVHDPDETRFREINKPCPAPRESPCPSLYQIAEAAFARRWSKRKTSWTEDELLRIELDPNQTEQDVWWIEVPTRR